MIDPDHPYLPAALNMRQVAEYIGVSRAHVFKLIETEGFPPGFYISEHRRVILRSEIDAWLMKRSTERVVRMAIEPPNLAEARKAGRPRKNANQSALQSA